MFMGLMAKPNLAGPQIELAQNYGLKARDVKAVRFAFDFAPLVGFSIGVGPHLCPHADHATIR